MAGPSSSGETVRAPGSASEAPQIRRYLPRLWLAAFEQKAKPHRGRGYCGSIS